MDRDRDQLRLLSILHYVVAGLVGLLGSVFLVYVALGAFMLAAPDKFGGKGPPPPAAVGWVFNALGVAIFLFCLALAFAIVVAGRSLAGLRRYVFCQVMAGLCCLFSPLGTLLGIFTLVVLQRPSVRALFARPP